MRGLRFRLWIYMLLLLLVTGTACTLSGMASQALRTITPQGTTQPDLTLPAIHKTRVLGLSATATPSQQPQASNSLELNKNGLNHLQSYRASMKITTSGKGQDGQPETTQFDLFQEVNHPREMLRAGVITSDGGLAPASVTELYIYGSQAYLFTQQGQQQNCQVFANSQIKDLESLGIVRPEDIFKDFRIEKLVASGEMVNGIKTDHYQIHSLDLKLGQVEAQKGDAWIAQEGGYIVRFTGQADGTFSLINDRAQGTLAWDYNVTGIDQFDDIPLPSDCQAAHRAEEDIPVPPNAVEKSSHDDLIAFSSPDSARDVASFYHGQFPVRGWTITDEKSLGPIIIINATKANRAIQVTIAGQDTQGSNVLITPE